MQGSRECRHGFRCKKPHATERRTRYKERVLQVSMDCPSKIRKASVHGEDPIRRSGGTMPVIIKGKSILFYTQTPKSLFVVNLQLQPSQFCSGAGSALPRHPPDAGKRGKHPRSSLPCSATLLGSSTQPLLEAPLAAIFMDTACPAYHTFNTPVTQTLNPKP